MARALPLVVLAVLSLGLGWFVGRRGAENEPALAPDSALVPVSELASLLEEWGRLDAERGALLRIELEALRAERASSARALESIIALVADLRTRAQPVAGSESGAGTPVPERVRDLASGDAPSRGPLDALVTVVEFSDFECPHCGTMAAVIARIASEYGDRVRVVFKHCPLAVHPHAFDAHQAAVAAGLQGRFWEMYELLFARQDRLDAASLREHARTLGLNAEQFDEDIGSEDVIARVAADRAEASAAGVRRVPTFFVNGLRLEGAQPFAVLRGEIEAELARLRAAGDSR